MLEHAGGFEHGPELGPQVEIGRRDDRERLLGLEGAGAGVAPEPGVTLRSGASTSGDEIIAFCKERLAKFKVPKTVVFGELPKTSTGKIQKFELREKARALK